MEERYCAHCGSRPEGPTCCWYVDGEEEEPRPHPLVPGKPWAEWTARQRFLPYRIVIGIIIAFHTLTRTHIYRRDIQRLR